MSELSQNQEVVVDTPPTKKRKTRSSDVWQYFNIEGDGIVCQQCGKSYKRNTSTYSLRYHLVKTHHISSNHSASTSAVSSDSFRSEKADELLAVYLCKNALGPDTVLQTSFAELMAFLEPKWVVSTPHGLQDHVFPALRAKITEHLRHTLSDVKYMSLSLETWVAMSDSRFVAVSVHGINHSFEFKSFLLEVAAVPILASADFIAHFVQRVLAQWGIELERVTAGSHNGSGEFAENCRSAIENNLGLLWVNCIASTLNKAVRGGLQAETIASTVARAESLCKFFLCSAQAGKVLQEQHKRLEGASLPLNVNIPSSNSASTPTSLISVPLNNIGNTGGSSSSSSSSLGKYKEGTLLYLDTSRATSWVSAYKMITHLLRSQASVCAALSILASANTATEVPVIPSEAEWLILGSIAAVVKPIYHATKFISVQRYPSMSGVIPVMERLLTHHLAITPTSPEEMNVGCSSTQLGGGADTTVADAPLHEGVAKALQESIAHEISNEWKRFDVNTVSDTMLLAVYLDPRLKDFAFVADENDRASLIQRAASLVERLIFSPDAPSCRGNIAGISDPMCVDNGPGQQEKWAGLLGPLAEDVPDQVRGREREDRKRSGIRRKKGRGREREGERREERREERGGEKEN